MVRGGVGGGGGEGEGEGEGEEEERESNPHLGCNFPSGAPSTQVIGTPWRASVGWWRW